ncbi:O-antigen polymerase [Salmonella bongori CFSAN000509]|uniref:O-antigen polymerase n=2 Tax=Salmonella bongori TaxID=54736 RepID=A0A702BPE5_SALBN|nr:O-antigen polysaccharide polymerase [Salmonella bongori]AID27306.1 Wzy [Salmonella bongori serovar 48:z41:-- str. RKS3044]EGS1129284.1 O-antigen polymerase [Salmonella bongori CFSAN000509]MBA3226330.1 O-antigen polymerase [Salmonella bongori]HAC6695673.1 O-antigen polymerase [Salmonella bongori serovar 44:r:-]
MIIKKNKFVYSLLKVWLIVSSLYYLNAIFSGVDALKYNEDLTQKFIKYAICFIISFIVLFNNRRVKYLWASLFFILLSVSSVIISNVVTVYATTMLIIATMLGFSQIIVYLSNDMSKINMVLLWTGVIVGTISVLELTVFYDYMVSYWTSTGGIRSISSLLNPTNSGAYSAIIILIALATNIRNKFKKTLFVLMPMITLISSGSRTAWLSLALTLLLTVLLNDKASMRLRKKILAIAGVGAICGVVYAVFYMSSISNIQSQYRGLDTYTASIRVENFMTYINSIDLGMLFPDFLDKNINLISDNFYLVLVNYFGIIGFYIFFLISMLLFYYNAQIKYFSEVIDEDIAIWRVIFIYFLISGLSNSFISSFPVNQLFFISCGYYVYKYKLIKKNAGK